MFQYLEPEVYYFLNGYSNKKSKYFSSSSVCVCRSEDQPDHQEQRTGDIGITGKLLLSLDIRFFNFQIFKYIWQEDNDIKMIKNCDKNVIMIRKIGL